ncbi:MAG: DUF2059 domain-containing protein [Pseudomonadota bacterium]
MNRIFCAAFLLAATIAVADPAPDQTNSARPEQQVLTLINLMRTDELLANAARDGVRRAHSEKKISDEARKCAERIDRSRFTALVAKIYAERLNPEELDKAIEFYRTEAGKKYTRYIFERAKGKPIGQFTTGEEMRINQFGQTSYGRKLLTSSILEGAEDIRMTTAAAINEAIAGCNAEPAPVK